MKPIDLQKALTDHGFDPGAIDGLWGRNTALAVTAWFQAGTDLDAAPDVHPAGQQTMSAKGIEFLIGWEGDKLTAYKDSAGIWTIGVGHTSAAGLPKVVAGMMISAAESRTILARDLAIFEKRVRREFEGNVVPQHVFDGAVSFDFNTGAIDSASWPNYWRLGDFLVAEAKLKDWNKAGGRVVAGLISRRAAEANMIFRDDYTGRP